MLNGVGNAINFFNVRQVISGRTTGKRPPPDPAASRCSAATGAGRSSQAEVLLMVIPVLIPLLPALAPTPRHEKEGRLLPCDATKVLVHGPSPFLDRIICIDTLLSFAILTLMERGQQSAQGQQRSLLRRLQERRHVIDQVCENHLMEPALDHALPRVRIHILALPLSLGQRVAKQGEVR